MGGGRSLRRTLRLVLFRIFLAEEYWLVEEIKWDVLLFLV